MSKPIKIVITGAESTGKSTIAKGLAEHFNSIWIPELARDYIEKLKEKYTYTDVEAIALKQIEIEQGLSSDGQFIFFDTWLIITKVWFDFVYHKHPAWLNDAIKKCDVDLFLLCDIDMPWIDDPVRENGGMNRHKLQLIYINELEHYGFNYKIIQGMNNERINNAIAYISDYLKAL